MTTNRDNLNDQFSLTVYMELLSTFLERGYNVVSYAEASPSQQHLILRHDVDFDLNAALRMAKMEAEEGLVASYFILLRTEFYNIFSRNGTDALQQLAMLGHNIGLHFDSAFYTSEDTDLGAAATAECDLLANIVGQPVDIVSLHRPPHYLLAQDLEIPNRINAYSERFFKEMAYCSDSRGAWNFGHPLNMEAVDQGKALQLLTHPIWWAYYDDASPQVRIEKFLGRRLAQFDQEAEANCEIYKRATRTRTVST